MLHNYVAKEQMHLYCWCHVLLLLYVGHSHDNGAESEHSDPEIKGSQNQIMEGT